MDSGLEVYRGFFGVNIKSYPGFVNTLETILWREAAFCTWLGVLLINSLKLGVPDCAIAFILFIVILPIFRERRDRFGYHLTSEPAKNARKYLQWVTAFWLVSRGILVASFTICIWETIFN